MSSEQQSGIQVSVVIPSYNSDKYISRAIDSVLTQTRPPEEIIVVDDGSTDQTAQVVSLYGGRIEYIWQENAGSSVARNTGIEAARGKWIAFLDADDEWLPERLEEQFELLRRNHDLVWVTGNYLRCVCRSGHRQQPCLDLEIASSALERKEYFESFFSAFLLNCWGCTDTMLIKRQALVEAGLFRPGQLRDDDYDMWWRIAYRWPKIGFVPRPLAIYHLDIESSIIRKHHDDASISCDLIQRHLALSQQHGMLGQFTPVAERLLRRWMRAMLFDARSADIRKMLSQFDKLLPARYRMCMFVLTIFPRCTACGCRAISWLARRFNLRKKPVRSRTQ